MARPLPMNRPVPMAPPSPIITICVLPRPRCNPVSRSAIGRGFMRRAAEAAKDGAGLFRQSAPPASVVVRDAGVVPGTDHADDVETLGRGCLEGVQLLARQENHIAGPHPRLAVLGPHAAFAR